MSKGDGTKGSLTGEDAVRNTFHNKVWARDESTEFGEGFRCPPLLVAAQFGHRNL